MSEQYKSSHEHKETIHSHEVNTEALQKKHEKELSTAEKEHGSKEHIEAIRNKVEQQAPIKQEQNHSEKEQPKHHPVLVNKQLKDMAFSRTMTRTRKKLSAPSRTFSKIVHVSAIEKSSEFVGKTIARPSSMLAGAFIAFVGTSALLWATKYYGYKYNYLLVILLFIGGAIAGIAIETLWRIRTKKQ
jgi:hypothetical protein